jgi:hypothetical protein
VFARGSRAVPQDLDAPVAGPGANSSGGFECRASRAAVVEVAIGICRGRSRPERPGRDRSSSFKTARTRGAAPARRQKSEQRDDSDRRTASRVMTPDALAHSRLR